MTTSAPTTKQRFAARVKRLERYDTCDLDTLREIVAPLVVGNVTTVGAFMALIPSYIFRWLMRHDRRFRANIEARNIE